MSWPEQGQKCKRQAKHNKEIVQETLSRSRAVRAKKGKVCIAKTSPVIGPKAKFISGSGPAELGGRPGNFRSGQAIN